MISVQKDFEANSTLSAGLIIKHKNAILCPKHAYEAIHHGRATLINTSIYHSRLIQDIASKNAYKQAQFVSKAESRQVPSSNMEEAITNLKHRLTETTNTLQECINTLAEEHRNSKRWRSQFEKASRRLLELQQQNNSQDFQRNQFLEKRQGLVNALLPIARPTVFDQEKWKAMQALPPKVSVVVEQSKESYPLTSPTGNNLAKYNIEPEPFHPQTEKVRIYIPQTSTCLSVSSQSIQSAQMWANVPKQQDYFSTTHKIPFLLAKQYVASQLK